MRVQYGERFCPNVIPCKFAPRERFEKLMDVNHTPLPVVSIIMGEIQVKLKQANVSEGYINVGWREAREMMEKQRNKF